MENELVAQRANAAAAAASGGIGFTDSRDISKAISTAVEDAGNTYVLGFYPAEETLDNKFHALTVKVGSKGAVRRRSIDVRARPGYLASRVGQRAPVAASIEGVLSNPLDSTAIGITAVPGPADGKYQVAVMVDLHDVHFERQGDRHVATITLSFADEGSRQIETQTLKISYTDAEFSAALARGLNVSRIFGQKSMLRFVARDVMTGAAGSLWVAPPQSSMAATPSTGPQQL